MYCEQTFGIIIINAEHILVSVTEFGSWKSVIRVFSLCCDSTAVSVAPWLSGSIITTDKSTISPFTPTCIIHTSWRNFLAKQHFWFGPWGYMLVSFFLPSYLSLKHDIYRWCVRNVQFKKSVCGRPCALLLRAVMERSDWPIGVRKALN